MKDPAEIADNAVDWFDRNKGGIALLVGFFLGLWLRGCVEARAQELPPDHPRFFQASFPCPTGGQWMIVTPDPELVILHALVVSGRISAPQFRQLTLHKMDSDQVTQFLIECMGTKGEI